MEYQREYYRWLENTSGDVLDELRGMPQVQIEDAFYRELTFGTGGLRGIIGAGTNRMNTYIVAKASQGLANYLGTGASVVIGYDSRIKSELFARTAAAVFAANGITVYLWSTQLPVPTVSFAVRKLSASAGVMITASHNPSKYNGYKVYGPDGCQITTEAAEDILDEINKVDVFSDVKRTDYTAAVVSGSIQSISDSVLTEYIEAVKGQSVLFGDTVDRNVAIVYTPLNGTGLIPVMRVLKETGFTNITVVEEQKMPDGCFPTCPYPNPEVREAMELGLQYCARNEADLLLATDPDADRCGIAVKDGNDYRLLTGNEVGLLLLDYICEQRIKHGTMPLHPVLVKTIVTTGMAEKIAAHYGVDTVNVLTGFKFIGEVIGKMDAEGNGTDYIFGFEESYGYLTGIYVRDKDAVDAAFMICEMFAYYRSRGLSFLDKLRQLYETYGYCRNTLHSYAFEGSAGMEKMKSVMEAFRKGLTELAGRRVLRTEDYSYGLHGLPPSDVLLFDTGMDSVVVRPSGTEPKLKVYISVTAKDPSEAEKREREILLDLESKL
jgi:phosphoglucomutase